MKNKKLKVRTKISIVLLMAFILFVLVHNLFYVFFGFEESAFFILALFSIGGIIAVGLYALIHEAIVACPTREKRRNNSIIGSIDKKGINNRKITFGDRFANKITNGIGSWRFIIIQSIILVIWMILNVVAWVSHWDPYPFILLNLALSFQAAYAAPIIMMSQNRTTARDRKKADWDLATDRRAERGIVKIEKDLRRLERGKIAKILKILEEQNKK